MMNIEFIRTTTNKTNIIMNMVLYGKRMYNTSNGAVHACTILVSFLVTIIPALTSILYLIRHRFLAKVLHVKFKLTEELTSL